MGNYVGTDEVVMNEEVRLDCDCIDWFESINEINKSITFMWTHGITYKGKQFEYCPWCGGYLMKLPEVKTDERDTIPSDSTGG